MIGFVVVGLAVWAALCLAVFAMGGVLVALGVVSTSVLVGLLTGRTSSGVRALVAQLCILSSVGSAVAGVWLVSRLGHLGLPLRTVVAGGLGCGLLIGVALACSVDYLRALASRKLVSGAEKVPGTDNGLGWEVH